MSRPLLALSVVAAASVVGVWIQAATHGASPPVTSPAPVALIGSAETGPAVATARPVTPARELKSAPAPRGAAPGLEVSSAAQHGLGAAMRAALDPQTGQLAAPEHSGVALTIAEMQNLARQEGEGLVTIHNPDGSETLNHEGRFADYTVVRMGPAGRPTFQCIHGKVGLNHALHPAAPATPKREDR